MTLLLGLSFSCGKWPSDAAYVIFEGTLRIVPNGCFCCLQVRDQIVSDRVSRQLTQALPRATLQQIEGGAAFPASESAG